MPLDTVWLMVAVLMLGAILILAFFLTRAAGPEAQRDVLRASGSGLATLIVVIGLAAIILKSSN